MASVVILGVGLSAFMALMMKEDKEGDDSVSWYDYYNSYYIFPEEYTDIIDTLLTTPNCASIGQKIILSQRFTKPAVGKHLYYINKSKDNLNSITFEKKRKTVDNREIYYYRCYVGYDKDKIFQDAVNKIFITDEKTVRTISIDTSSGTPNKFYMTKIYKTPYQYQLDITEFIIREFNNNPSHNVNALISGVRGSGKTFIGRVLKKELEQNLGITVKLFDDFNPSDIGVNVKSIILTEAHYSPIIILIDEFDVILNEVTREKQLFGDSRILHTKNKLSFNSMMDAINDTPNVIALFTTEKSPEELYQKVEHRSFIRKGRIDNFIKVNGKNVMIRGNDLTDLCIKSSESPKYVEKSSDFPTLESPKYIEESEDFLTLKYVEESEDFPTHESPKYVEESEDFCIKSEDFPALESPKYVRK